MASLASGVSLGTSQSNPNVSNRFAELSTEQFLKVLFTELQNQDPLQPQDSSKMLEQLSSLRNIESQLSLQDQLKSLVTANQVAIAGGLIGKMVEGRDENLSQTRGLVTSVRVAGKDVFLELDNGKSMKMSAVTQIAAPAGTGV